VSLLREGGLALGRRILICAANVSRTSSEAYGLGRHADFCDSDMVRSMCCGMLEGWEFVMLEL
jgi:hypothetical protein